VRLPCRQDFGASLALILGIACARDGTASTQQVRQPPPRASRSFDSVSVAGGTLHYRSAGSGDAVVLLSGGPGIASSFLEPVFDHVATRHRAVLIDQRGTGRSTGFVDSTTFILANAVDDIDAVRRQLGVEHIVLLGHSWGGALAMAYAAKYPNRVAGLVLVGAGSLRPKASSTEISRRLRARLTPADVDSIRSLAALVPNPAQRDSALRAIRLLNWKAYEYDPANVAALAPLLVPQSFNDRTARLMNADLVRHGPAFAARLESSRLARELPTLIAYGEVDPIGLVTRAEIQAAFPRAQVQVIPRSGHHPWNENAMVFYRAVDDFLGSIDER
jgi:proline iminopeptidase